MLKMTFYVLICFLTASCSLGPFAMLQHTLEIMDKYYHNNDRNIKNAIFIDNFKENEYEEEEE
ncbi:hypothetical protein F0310_04945 (plasmid) [Borrelia sp. A-FGy1]|uniref:hypothetical protein n=1 Tax=Borrelia sp. A-FGy1 TaxID=2608247 RepID=UPI0015F46DDC|nr:hypothetical protein [Borrelia sp. A-FGy1]QMU99763.1 hypothetical protein F0310_04945 [Borrelia sp. A-FGy1]